MTAHPRKSELVDKTRAILAFRFLSPEETADLLNVSEVLEFEEGEPVIEEGELSPWFYGIIQGTVGVNVKEPEGGQVYVNSLGEGEVFGEAGIFQHVHRTASVVALEQATILRIHRREFAAFLERNAVSGNKVLLVIIFSLLRKLRQVNRELAYERKSDLGQDDVDAMIEGLFGDKGNP